MFETDCPSKQQLATFLIGTLDEMSASELMDHLEDCTTCEVTLQEMECLSDTVIERLREPVAEDRYLKEAAYVRFMAKLDAIPTESATLASMQTNKEEKDELCHFGQLGDYELLAKLGEGGMGTVYKARHIRMDRLVALKVLAGERLESQQARDRFDREIKAMGRFDHPNIVRALDAGAADDAIYLVMELVEGVDLKHLVRGRGRLPISDACELARQAAVGLEHAFQNGLVHRDIKPSNLMLTTTPAHQDGVVKILDLGLARLQDHCLEENDLTADGQFMGTLDYMAPEQGVDSHEVDIRADIYSLGATLYKLLTGHSPLSGLKFRSPVKKMMAIANTPVKPIREHREEISESLSDLIHRMLAKSPDERYPTPEEVAEALEPFARQNHIIELLHGPVVEAQPESATTHYAEPTPSSVVSDAGAVASSIHEPTSEETSSVSDLPLDHDSSVLTETPASKESSVATEKEAPRWLAPWISAFRSRMTQLVHVVTPGGGYVRRPIVAVALAAMVAIVLLQVTIATKVFEFGEQPDRVVTPAVPQEQQPAPVAKIDEPTQPLIKMASSDHIKPPIEQTSHADDAPKPPPASPHAEPVPLSEAVVIKMKDIQVVGRVETVCFSPLDNVVAWSTSLGNVDAMSVAGFDSQPYQSVTRKDGRNIVFSADETAIVTSEFNGSINIWQGSPLRGREVTYSGNGPRKVMCLSFSPTDSGVFASAGDDHKVRVWNTRTGEQIHAISFGNKLIPRCVKFSPDGTKLATSWATSPDARSGQIVISRTVDGKQIAVLDDVLRLGVDDFLFSNSRNLVTTTSLPYTITVWDTMTGKAVRPHGEQVYFNKALALTASPNGELVASGDSEGTIWLWDRNTGDKTPLKGPEGDEAGAIKYLHFPNVPGSEGKYLISVGDDDKIRIWNLQSREPVTIEAEHDGSISAVAATENGRTMATAGDDGQIKVWNVIYPGQ